MKINIIYNDQKNGGGRPLKIFLRYLSYLKILHLS